MLSCAPFAVNVALLKCGQVPQLYGYDCIFLLPLPVPPSDVFGHTIFLKLVKKKGLAIAETLPWWALRVQQ